MSERNKTCPRCGKALPIDSEFCQFCGFNLSSKNMCSSEKLITEINVGEIAEDAKLIVQKISLYSVDDEKCYIRCCFQSFSDKIISAVLFDIRCFDIFGNELPIVRNAQILDLSVQRDETFENSKRIFIDNSNVRMARIIIRKVLFSDGSIMECSGKTDRLSTPTLLENRFDSLDLVQQFIRDTSSNSKFYPEQMGSFWLCSCGSLNLNTESSCNNCYQNKEKLFALSDVDKLKARLLIYNAERVAQEKEEQEKMNQEKQAQIQYENELRVRNDRYIAFLKRIEAVQAAKKRKKRIKIIVGVVIAILITVFIIIEVQKSQYNGQLRNFATESMCEDYTNVYADVVSIEPIYFVYQYKENKYGTKIGSEQLWDVVCRCKTVEGKTIWISVFYQYYPGGNYSSNEADYKTITYSSSNPKRITGGVDTARQVVSELESKIGNVYVLDVRS